MGRVVSGTLRTDFTDYLTVRRLSLLNGFTFVSVFSDFSFLNRFPLQLFFSFSLLSTPISQSLVCFVVNQSDYHFFFFSFFWFFHKLIVLMR